LAGTMPIWLNHHRQRISEMRWTTLRSRRFVLSGIAAVATAGGVLRPAAALVPTPRQTKGPFYPLTLPLDKDNDLVRVDGAARRALGTVTHVAGRVFDLNGRPVSGARVEIWQCDANGRYHHPGDGNSAPEDAGFQGYGETLSDVDGAYRFRTIRPVPYPGRTAHIHFAISGQGFDPLVTQMYVAGEPGNADDGILNHIDATARERVIVALSPAPEIEADALKGAFDIVLEV
jgi:protocatechuate 3,4-dioxygenase, beta subunit